jgi:hypothetical protein
MYVDSITLFLFLLFAALAVAGVAFFMKRNSRSAESGLTGGIMTNPPTFIEVIENKPLMVKVDNKYTFIVRHPSSIESISYLQKLRQLFHALKAVQSKEYTASTEKTIQAIYLSIALVLFSMSRKEYKGYFKQRAYRKALIIRSVYSTEWLVGVVSELNDFWKLIKKKEQYQADGVTLRQTHGEKFTWALWRKVSAFTN